MLFHLIRKLIICLIEDVYFFSFLVACQSLSLTPTACTLTVGETSPSARAKGPLRHGEYAVISRLTLAYDLGYDPPGQRNLLERGATEEGGHYERHA